MRVIPTAYWIVLSADNGESPEFGSEGEAADYATEHGGLVLPVVNLLAGVEAAE